MAEPLWHPELGEPWTFDSLRWRLEELARDALNPPSVGRALPVDVGETDEEYVLEVELPGISKEDVHIDVAANEIRVRGEIKRREDIGRLRYHTRRVGSFDNQVALPGEVDGSRTQATLADGVLTVHAPKTQSAQSPSVEVTIA